MNRDKVNRAAAACLQEAAEPSKSYGTVAVAYGGGSELGFAGVGLHVHVPGVGGFLRGEVGLFGEIGFVESEKMGGARGDGGVGVGLPAGGVHVKGTPHHGDEVEVGREGASGLGVPVVAP